MAIYMYCEEKWYFKTFISFSSQIINEKILNFHYFFFLCSKGHYLIIDMLLVSSFCMANQQKSRQHMYTVSDSDWRLVRHCFFGYLFSCALSGGLKRLKKTGLIKFENLTKNRKKSFIINNPIFLLFKKKTEKISFLIAFYYIFIYIFIYTCIF
jgi:hypothetical protein